MKALRHLPGVVSLAYDREACVGCGRCTEVCPHGVFRLEDGKAVLADRDGCMECGACANNCAVGALSVSPGTGCASLIIHAWIDSLLGRRAPRGGGCC